MIYFVTLKGIRTQRFTYFLYSAASKLIYYLCNKNTENNQFVYLSQKKDMTFEIYLHRGYICFNKIPKNKAIRVTFNQRSQCILFNVFVITYYGIDIPLYNSTNGPFNKKYSSFPFCLSIYTDFSTTVHK